MRPPSEGVAAWFERGEARYRFDQGESEADATLFATLKVGDAMILADDDGKALAVGVVKAEATAPDVTESPVPSARSLAAFRAHLTMYRQRLAAAETPQDQADLKAKTDAYAEKVRRLEQGLGSDPDATEPAPADSMDTLVPVDWIPLRPARTLSAPPIWMRRAIVPAPREMLDRCLTQRARTIAPDEIPFETILSGIGDVGLRLEDAIVRRYHVALKTRGFVILAGVSGTGKTWLAEAYANIVGARCLVEPVAPNWTTNEDLLGYLNPLDGVFHETRFTRFLMQAAEAHEAAQGEGQPAQAFHVVLDEMNLARVEHYFARFLSAMEQRMRASNGVATVPLCPGREVALTPNLRFIGTVNMDETTHGFADKVFDRAQLVELPVSREAIRQHLVGRPCADLLVRIWEAVAPAAPFAFRVLDDIDAYIGESEALGADRSVALDEQVLQKILPKIRGTDTAVGEALEALMRVCGDTLPLSRRRAEIMLQSARDHGFASFF